MKKIILVWLFIHKKLDFDCFIKFEPGLLTDSLANMELLLEVEVVLRPRRLLSAFSTGAPVSRSDKR